MTAAMGSTKPTAAAAALVDYGSASAINGDATST
jgi:hypothetical protein